MHFKLKAGFACLADTPLDINVKCITARMNLACRDISRAERHMGRARRKDQQAGQRRSNRQKARHANNNTKKERPKGARGIQQTYRQSPFFLQTLDLESKTEELRKRDREPKTGGLRQEWRTERERKREIFLMSDICIERESSNIERERQIEREREGYREIGIERGRKKEGDRERET